MLITPTLERWLLEGIAQYKTYSVGVSSLFTIPVKRGSYIILRQIRFHHFFNSAQNPTTYEQYQDYFVKQLSLAEEGKPENALMYFFRTPWNMSRRNASNLYDCSIPVDVDTIETWAQFNANVCGDLIYVPSVTNLPDGGFTNNPTTTIAQTKERSEPAGFGTGTLMNLNDVNFGPLQLQSAGQRRPLAGLTPATSGYSEQFKYPVSAAQQMIDPNAATELFTAHNYPIITFGYFEVNHATAKIK